MERKQQSERNRGKLRSHTMKTTPIQGGAHSPHLVPELLFCAPPDERCTCGLRLPREPSLLMLVSLRDCEVAVDAWLCEAAVNSCERGESRFLKYC